MHSGGNQSVHRERDGESLWRRGQRRGQYEAVRTIDGRRERRTLSTSDAATADRLIDQLNRQIITGGKTTIAALFDSYRHTKERQGRWGRDKLHAYKAIVPIFGHMQPDDITIDLCEDYTARRRAQGYAADTVRLELAYLRAALRHAADRQIIDRAPKIPVPPRGRPRERYLSPDEVFWLIEASPEAHMKLFIALSVATAARPSHILQLQWSAVDFEHKLIDFGQVDKAAGNKQRPRIPMNATAERELRNALLLRRTPYVIEWRGKPVQSVKTGIRRASERAGLSDVTPYVLRHTAGVWMARAGVSIEKIAAYMGHSNIEVTRRHYAHFQPDFMVDASAALELQPQKINMLEDQNRG